MSGKANISESLAKGLAILDLFGVEDAGFTLSEIAARVEPVPRRFSALIGQSAILHWVETIFNRHTLLSGVCAHIAGSRRLFPI